MAEFNVGLSQLQEVCDYFVEADYPYFEELREAFKLLRITGCRIQEIFEIDRWSIVSGYEVTCQPQKGNQIRYITLNSDFTNFLTAIENQYKPFLGRTVSQLEYLFKKINPYGGLFSGDRAILNYIYRYCYIRELHADGLTHAEIAAIMGHNNPSVISNYLNADLSSQIEIPNIEFISIGSIDYEITQFGSLMWMKKPLRNIPLSNDYVHVNNDSGNDQNFGLLYNPGSIPDIIAMLPAGWRLPSFSDLQALNLIMGTDDLFYTDINLQGLTFWNSIFSSTLNFLALVGTGFKQGPTFYFFKQYSIIALSDFDASGQRLIWPVPNIQARGLFTWAGFDGEIYSSIRFVKSV